MPRRKRRPRPARATDSRTDDREWEQRKRLFNEGQEGKESKRLTERERGEVLEENEMGNSRGPLKPEESPIKALKSRRCSPVLAKSERNPNHGFVSL